MSTSTTKKKPAGSTPAGSTDAPAKASAEILDFAAAYPEPGFVGELRAMGFRLMPLPAGAKKPPPAGYPTNGVDYVIPEGRNAAIDTGHFWDGGALLVLDVDKGPGKHGGESLRTLEAAHGALPRTLTTITPTGGKHLFFRVQNAVRSSAGTLGKNLDVRSQSAYVVAPGSTVKAGKYRFEGQEHRPAGSVVAAGTFPPIADAPAWLVELCGQPRERSTEPFKPLTGYAAEVATEKARAYLVNDAPAAVEGDAGDLTTFSVAARVRDFGVSPGDCLDLMLEHWNERCSPPWSPTELERKVRNAYEYAKGEAGNANPAAIFDPVPDEDKANVPAQHTTFRIVSAGDVLDEPDTEWLLEGLMPACGLGLIYGEPGTGKSFLALDIAAAIACGLTWGERRVRRPGPVVYVGLEGRQKLRIEAYMKHHGRDRAAMRDVRIVQGQPLDLSHPKCEPAAILARDIREIVPGVRAVFVDTLSRALHGGDENSSEYMGRAVAAADQLGKQLECLVVLVHHSGKNSKKGARGHSLLHGATDVEIEVTRNGDTREVKAAKVKDGEDGLRWEFRLRPVGLGVTADGAARSSCVIENLQPVRGSSRRLTPIQTAVLEALKRAGDAKMGGVTTGADGFAEVSVSREEWRAAYYEAEGGDAKKRRQLKSRFDDASRALIAQSRVQSCGQDRYALAA